MLSFLSLSLSFCMSKATFVPTSAVKRLIKIPRLSVTAKPLIGPLPNWKRTKAVIKVVTLESTIVHHARS
jgi:hypothetical protein